MPFDPTPLPHAPCAICAATLHAEARYPQKVCRGCEARASDESGRRLVFTNVSISGGFVARYADTGEPYPGEHACWIDGIACHANEHYHGGIVVQRRDRPMPRIDLTDARVTLPCALAWRAIAEIARRRHRSHRLRVEQFHTGVSTIGGFALELDPVAAGPHARHEFTIDGPDPGRWCVRDEGEVELAAGDLASLLGDGPEHVVTWFESKARFPVMAPPLPAGGRFVRAIRLVAALLERRVFDRHPWRATLAAADGVGGPVVGDWHSAFVPPVARDEAGDLRPADVSRLSQLVLVHRGEACVWRTGDYTDGLAIDLQTDRLLRMDRHGLTPLGTVTEHYQAAGRSLPATVGRLP